MRLSLVIILISAVGLVCGAPFVHNENNDISIVSTGDDTSQQGGINPRIYHEISSITQFFDVVLKNDGGMDTGNNGNSNGDDGSHKPPSKRSLTTDHAHLLQLHHSKLPFFELSDFTWDHKAADLAQIRVAKCTTDVLGEKSSYVERLAIGNISWNDVLNTWWGENGERVEYIKRTLGQSTSQKKSVSVGCATQKCPHGPYYACNYLLSSESSDNKY